MGGETKKRISFIPLLRLHERKVLESFNNLAKLNGIKPLYLLGSDDWGTLGCCCFSKT